MSLIPAGQVGNFRQRDNATPSLHLHYKGFITTTGSSVPRSGIGILPHGVCHLLFPLTSGIRFSRSIPKPVLSSCRLYTDCRRVRKQVSSRLIPELSLGSGFGSALILTVRKRSVCFRSSSQPGFPFSLSRLCVFRTGVDCGRFLKRHQAKRLRCACVNHGSIFEPDSRHGYAGLPKGHEASGRPTDHGLPAKGRRGPLRGAKAAHPHQQNQSRCCNRPGRRLRGESAEDGCIGGEPDEFMARGRGMAR
jgi:hypothetical protein